MAGAVELHFFIKKDDGEGTDFYYLGTASASNATEGTMPGKNGKQLSVVHMDLNLDTDVSQDLFDYLETPSN